MVARFVSSLRNPTSVKPHHLRHPSQSPNPPPPYRTASNQSPGAPALGRHPAGAPGAAPRRGTLRAKIGGGASRRRPAVGAVDRAAGGADPDGAAGSGRLGACAALGVVKPGRHAVAGGLESGGGASRRFGGALGAHLCFLPETGTFLLFLMLSLFLATGIHLCLLSASTSHTPPATHPQVRAAAEEGLTRWLAEECGGDPLKLLELLDVETYTGGFV